MMTDQQHPISPPWELVEKWAIESPIQANDENWAYELYIAHYAARWGADQELEACCEYMQHEDFHGFAKELRSARRPNPPSLKQQALAALAAADGADHPIVATVITADQHALIRRALQQLDD